MSADAKIWQEDNGDWRGICDAAPGTVFDSTAYGLSLLILDIEEAMHNTGMRWEFNVYPDGKAGLRGYTY